MIDKLIYTFLVFLQIFVYSCLDPKAYCTEFKFLEYLYFINEKAVELLARGKNQICIKSCNKVWMGIDSKGRH